MSANYWNLFLIRSNGKLYSIGCNEYGAAARGMENVENVELGECEIKIAKNQRMPYFTKVVGYRFKVAALTNNGQVYLCGQDILPFMGEKSTRNLYGFKKLEVPCFFTDVDFGHNSSIVGFTSDQFGVKIERGGNLTKCEGIRNWNTNQQFTESLETVYNKRIVKYLNHAQCDIHIYNDFSVDIKYKGMFYTIDKFSCPVGYPNDGSMYELSCSIHEMYDWKPESFLMFYWKFNKDKYLSFEKFIKKLKFSQYNQLTDITIKFH